MVTVAAIFLAFLIGLGAAVVFLACMAAGIFAGYQLAHFAMFLTIWIRQGGDAAGEFLYRESL